MLSEKMDIYCRYGELGGRPLVCINRINHWRGDTDTHSWTAVFPSRDAAYHRYVNRRTLIACIWAVIWRLLASPAGKEAIND